SLDSGAWLPVPASLSGDTLTINDAKNVGHTFRIGFKDANGVYNFTGDIADGVDKATLQSDLEALPDIGTVGVAGGAGSFTIPLTDPADLARLEVVASANRLLSLPLNLNLNLGSLVDISSANSLDVFAALQAQFSFGIDLSPSAPIAVQANQFSPS